MTTTENVDPRFSGLETWSSDDLAEALLSTQSDAALAAQAAAANMALAIDRATQALEAGGRLIYMGAGTSGRLAVLDAAELPPTFDWPRDRAIALMAGGNRAITDAVEGAEDNAEAALDDLSDVGLAAQDVVIGVAASGRTPYVVAGVAHAKSLGALTIAITNVPGSALAQTADLALVADTGAEIIAGSTRMKAGTAQKILLNCLSTGIMVRLGYVFRGRMVEMRPTNVKLRARAIAMIADLASVPLADAEAALDAAGNTKTAVAMLIMGISREVAEHHLKEAHGNLGRALANSRR